MKFKYILIALLLSSALLQSCNFIGQAEVQVERPILQSSPLDTFYQAMRPSVERFKITADKTVSVKSESGIEVLVPANSFVDGFGEPVTGEVAVEILAANSLIDFLTLDLQTMSDDKILESAGMMHIDAKSNGQSLRLADGKQLSITMPKMQPGSGFQMFTGKFDDEGKLNWVVDESAEEDYLIPFPAEVLYQDGWLKSELSYYYWGWGKDKDTMRYNPTLEKYNNTLIQTREFNRRLFKLYEGTHFLSVLLNQDKSWGEREVFEFDFRLLDLYYDNPTLEIQVLDSIANKIISDFVNSAAFQAWQEKDNSSNSNWYYEPNFTPYLAWLQLGTDGAKGNVVDLPSYEVDLLADNAFDQLVSRGATEKEAHLILKVEKERTAYINDINRLREFAEREHLAREFVEKTIFSTTQLGWINCDRFLNDPNAAEAEILVSITGLDSLDFTSLNLVIPNLNVQLSGYPTADGAFTFTQKEGIYTKLPIGQEAIVVGVSVKGDECYYDYEKIEIAKSLAIELNLEQVDKNALGAKFQELLSSGK